MKKRIFNTLVKQNHKFSKNEYVMGRIYGIAEIICEFDCGTKEIEKNDGTVITFRDLRGIFWTNKDESIRYLKTECTQEQYEKFKEYVENMYPGLCEFYWEKV